MPQLASTPVVFNLQIGAATTEYSYVIPNDCVKLRFQNRNNNLVRYAFEPQKVAASADPYMTLKAGGVFELINADVEQKTLYVAGTSGDVIEIEVWTQS